MIYRPAVFAPLPPSIPKDHKKVFKLFKPVGWWSTTLGLIVSTTYTTRTHTLQLSHINRIMVIPKVSHVVFAHMSHFILMYYRYLQQGLIRYIMLDIPDFLIITLSCIDYQCLK